MSQDMTLDGYEENQMTKRAISSIKCDEAYKILNEYLDSDEEEVREHTKRVVDICLQIVNKLEALGYHPNRDLLERSAIFHDIAKMKNDEKHHKIAKKVLKKHFYEDDELKKICSIIKAHKGKFEPLEKVELEAAVLRISDKIDKINKGDLNKFWKSYRKSLEKIKKNFKRRQYSFKRVKKSFDIVAVHVFHTYICFIDERR